jgi:hypothetical protein
MLLYGDAGGICEAMCGIQLATVAGGKAAATAGRRDIIIVKNSAA